MKIHHLSCGSYCAPAIPFLMPKGLNLCCHCLLLELENQLVLVDTGFSTLDMNDPLGRLGLSQKLAGMQPDLELTAFHQLHKLGFDPKDVRNIVVTHLDPDHVGGIQDFPGAKVHIYRKEYQIAVNGIREHKISAQRFRDVQWKNWRNWEFYDEKDGETYDGFGHAFPLRGFKDELALLPLEGHSGGHCGVIVEGDEKLLHAGDAYYNREELNTGHDSNLVEGLVAKKVAYDNSLRLRNLARLQKIAENPSLRIFCSHDHQEFENLKHRG